MEKFEEATTTLARAAELDKADSNIKAELARAEKDLKKFRYGW